MANQLPRGVRLNNPLNIERDGTQWEGMAPVQSDPTFVEYLTAAFGFRAGFRNLISYFDHHGLNTVRGILSRHSPAGGDNITADDPDGSKQLNAYIAAVCKRTGFGADEQIAPKTWEDGSKLIYAMTEHEQGGFEPYFTSAQMAEGAFRAGIADAPPPTSKRLVAKAAAVAGALSGGAGMAEPYVSTALQQPHSQNVQIALIVLGVALAVFGAFKKS